MRMSARPQNVHQARLLRLLRDEGPRSRAELGDVVRLSRSKLAVELDRLVEMGLVEGAGLAASRGGRRSGIVRRTAQAGIGPVLRLQLPRPRPQLLSQLSLG